MSVEKIRESGLFHGQPPLYYFILANQEERAALLLRSVSKIVASCALVSNHVVLGLRYLWVQMRLGAVRRP